MRFTIYDAEHNPSDTTLRNALGDTDVESAWAEGAAVSIDEAIAYAQRAAVNANDPPAGGNR